MPAFIDLTGRRFYRLVVLGVHAKSTRTPPRHNILWLCRCDCDNEVIVDGANLGKPLMQSCGCLKRERHTRHGHATKAPKPTATYYSWLGMKQRCANPKHPGYKNWGGRGITVCERWQTFENFLADMGPMPRGHSIERVNNDGNYEPSNCIWIPKSEQLNNRRPRTKKHAQIASQVSS